MGFYGPNTVIFMVFGPESPIIWVLGPCRVQVNVEHVIPQH